MQTANWGFPDDDDDLPDYTNHTANTVPIDSKQKMLGWVKYKFTDRVSGTIIPWETQNTIANTWEQRQATSIPFNNQKNLRIKIGSLVVCVLKTDGTIKKLNNTFLLWKKRNGYVLLLMHDTWIQVEPLREFSATIAFTTIRWNYRGDYLMIKPDNKKVNEKNYIQVLNILWGQFYEENAIDRQDLLSLIDQMQSHLEYDRVGIIIFNSLASVLSKELVEIIQFFRTLKELNLDRIVWNWGGITMTPVNFVRWLVEIDEYQPLIQTQIHVDIWKQCLKSLPVNEIENTLHLLKCQKASDKQTRAVEDFLST